MKKKKSHAKQTSLKLCRPRTQRRKGSDKVAVVRTWEGRSETSNEVAIHDSLGRRLCAALGMVSQKTPRTEGAFQLLGRKLASAVLMIS
jgi:hypothetical protein